MECNSEKLYCPAYELEGHKRGSGKCPSFNRAPAKIRRILEPEGKSGMKKIQDTHMMQCCEGREDDDIFQRGMVDDFL